MSDIDEIDHNEVFEYLDDLRESGVTDTNKRFWKATLCTMVFFAGFALFFWTPVLIQFYIIGCALFSVVVFAIWFFFWNLS